MKRTSLIAGIVLFLVTLARAGEAEAVQFEREGKLREAFDAYVKTFQAEPAGSAKVTELRTKIIALALKLNPSPQIPEEARKRVVFAVTALEEQTATGNEQAVKQFSKAVQIAPWWPQAYYNLGLLQEKQGDFKGAVENLQLYLAAAPDAGDVAAVKTHLFKLEYKLERLAEAEAAQMEFLPGVSVEPLTNEVRKELGLAAGVEGIVITRIAPDSPYLNKLPQGAVIRELNRVLVTDVASAKRALRDGKNQGLVEARGLFTSAARYVTFTWQEKGAALETALTPNGDAFPQVGTNYTVRAGDTITSIARKTGGKPQDIINANRIADQSKIKVGQTIFIPNGK